MRGLSRLVHRHGKFLELISGFGGSGSISLSLDDAGYGELVLDNAEKKGSMSAPMMLDLAANIDTLTHDEEGVTGLALRSTGSIFCAGLDLKLAKGLIDTGDKGAMMYNFMCDALWRLRSAPFVSVACLQGHAIGGGLELATATDYRIIVKKSDHEPYLQSVHAKIGATPGWGGLVRTKDIIGRKNTLTIYGTSQRVSAEAAQELGLVDHVEIYDDNQKDDFDSFCSATSRKFLHPFLSQPYHGSIRGIKRTVAAMDRQQEPLEIEGAVFRERWMGSDMQDALKK